MTTTKTTQAIKFNLYAVTNGTHKCRVWYSVNGRIDGRACVTVYAKDYDGNLSPIFGELVKNDSDSQTDYFEKDRVVLFSDHPLYLAALAAANRLAVKRGASPAPAAPAAPAVEAAAAPVARPALMLVQEITPCDERPEGQLFGWYDDQAVGMAETRRLLGLLTGYGLRLLGIRNGSWVFSVRSDQPCLYICDNGGEMNIGMIDYPDVFASIASYAYGRHVNAETMFYRLCAWLNDEPIDYSRTVERVA